MFIFTKFMFIFTKFMFIFTKFMFIFTNKKEKIIYYRKHYM